MKKLTSETQIRALANATSAPKTKLQKYINEQNGRKRMKKKGKRTTHKKQPTIDISTHFYVHDSHLFHLNWLRAKLRFFTRSSTVVENPSSICTKEIHIYKKRDHNQ